MVKAAPKWGRGGGEGASRRSRSSVEEEDLTLTRPLMCSASTTLREELALLVPRWKGPKASGFTAVIPQSVRSAWDFVERHVPDADLFERLRRQEKGSLIGDRRKKTSWWGSKLEPEEMEDLLSLIDGGKRKEVPSWDDLLSEVGDMLEED